MTTRNIKAIRWPLGCLIFFMCSCTQPVSYQTLMVTKEDSITRETQIRNAYKAIFLASRKIKNGDLITRTGNDFTSESLRMLNRRNTTYSHCGIASIEHDSIFVYHALGGEFNPDQKISRDLVSAFADPHSNRGIGIFSFGLPDRTQEKLILIVKDLFHKGVMFDMDFDLKTDGRMYLSLIHI